MICSYKKDLLGFEKPSYLTYREFHTTLDYSVVSLLVMTRKIRRHSRNPWDSAVSDLNFILCWTLEVTLRSASLFIENGEVKLVWLQALFTSLFWCTNKLVPKLGKYVQSTLLKFLKSLFWLPNMKAVRVNLFGGSSTKQEPDLGPRHLEDYGGVFVFLGSQRGG